MAWSRWSGPGRLRHPLLGFLLSILSLQVACAGPPGMTPTPPPTTSPPATSRPAASAPATPVVPDPPPSSDVPLAGPPALARPGTTIVRTLVSSGQSRQYRLALPRRPASAGPLPLILSLHGRGSTGAHQERLTRLSAVADRAGMAVAYPQARGEPATWHVGPGQAGDEDVRFLLALIDELVAHDDIDARRVYAVGLSNGAQLAHRLGCVAADRLAGLGLVAGGYPRAVPCQPSRPLSLIAIHGTDDAVLPYDGRHPVWWPIPDWTADWAQRNGCAARSQLTGQPGAVTAEAWANCRANATVVLYTIQGGDHRWPGTANPGLPRLTSGEIDATALIVEFVAAQAASG